MFHLKWEKAKVGVKVKVKEMGKQRLANGKTGCLDVAIAAQTVSCGTFCGSIFDVPNLYKLGKR